MKENIEEDIKLLDGADIKVFLSGMAEQSNYIVDKADEVNNAIENILSDYKRVLKENEDWQKTYQEEKDKQFDLLRENQKLQKENEELKEKWQIMLLGNAGIYKTGFLDGENAYKQKIKDKIEELKEKPLTINENNKYYYETDAYNKIIIQVLQDLLESEEK